MTALGAFFDLGPVRKITSIMGVTKAVTYDCYTVTLNEDLARTVDVTRPYPAIDTNTGGKGQYTTSIGSGGNKFWAVLNNTDYYEWGPKPCHDLKKATHKKLPENVFKVLYRKETNDLVVIFKNGFMRKLVDQEVKNSSELIVELPYRIIDAGLLPTAEGKLRAIFIEKADTGVLHSRLVEGNVSKRWIQLNDAETAVILPDLNNSPAVIFQKTAGALEICNMETGKFSTYTINEPKKMLGRHKDTVCSAYKNARGPITAVSGDSDVFKNKIVLYYRDPSTKTNIISFLIDIEAKNCLEGWIYSLPKGGLDKAILLFNAGPFVFVNVGSTVMIHKVVGKRRYPVVLKPSRQVTSCEHCHLHFTIAIRKLHQGCNECKGYTPRL